MIITVNTSESASKADLAILTAYLDSLDETPTPESQPEEAPKPKRTRKPKAEPVEESTPEPEPQAGESTPEPEPQAEESTPEPEPQAEAAVGPTKDDAIQKATELMGKGQRDKVKAALEAAGAGRVSELTDDQVAAFLAALDA